MYRNKAVKTGFQELKKQGKFKAIFAVVVKQFHDNFLIKNTMELKLGVSFFDKMNTIF